MDWLQIVATDSYWLQGLLMGVLPYAIFAQWTYCIIWLIAWLFIGRSDNVGYTAVAIVMMLIFLQQKIRSLFYAVGVMKRYEK